MNDRHVLRIEQELDVVQVFDYSPDTGIVLNIGVEPMGDEIEVFSCLAVEELVEALSDDLRDAQDFVGLYCVAHELSRMSEKLRERAMTMEDSLDGVGRLYEIDLSDMSELNEGLPE